jgi:hypothetical protein
MSDTRPVRVDVSAVWVTAIAIAAGLGAWFAPPEPTGNATADAVMRAAGVGLVVLFGARAPWWAVAVTAGAAVVIALDPVLIVLAAGALGAALWVGGTRRDRPEVLALSLAVAFNVLLRAELADPFAASAVVTGLLAALLVLTGIGHQTKLVRYAGWLGAGCLVLVAFAATAGFGFEAARARHDLGGGRTTAELGVAALENGDFDEAEEWFRESADLLGQAHERLTKPVASAAGLVPIVAQHRDAVVQLSGLGADGAAAVADALAEIDVDALRTVDGRIDLDAVAELDAPLTRVRAVLSEFEDTLGSVRSPWLVNRAEIELDDFEESIAEHLPSIDNSLAAIRLAPEMLGADGPRRYLVLFTTPSESRGLGGFVGNYAELTVDGGQFSMTAFGRAEDLDRKAQAAGARVTGHEEFLRQYGRFGFDVDENGNGRVGDAAFRNLAMTPNFPWVGAIAADLYTQTTGREVDGTLAMDPYVVAALLDYSGPIELTTIDEELTDDNAVSFLLRDQYVDVAEDKQQRIDALAEAAQLTFEALLTGELPEPVTLAEDLGPLVSDRRLLMWSRHPDEQALLEQVRMAGRIPFLDGADGWAVTVSNGAGNKIDSFLERRAEYDSSTDPDTGETTATLRVVLKNDAPEDGLPRYVIGNRVGAPEGTSRLYVSFYSPLALTGVTVDGAPSGLAVGREAGWNVYSRFVDIPAGSKATFELELEGTVARPDELVTWEQPMAEPLEVAG